MIQRIQTVFLFVACIATIVLLFIPFGTFIGCFSENLTGDCIFNAFTVRLNVPEPGNSIIARSYYIGLTLILSSIISLVSIFLYKNRVKQAKVVSLNMLIILVALALTYFIYPDFIFKKANLIYPESECLFNNWGLIIYLIPAVMMVLARRFILKDEAKVRAADRLR